MKKQITITLTVLEAKTLLIALGNATDYGDVLDDIFSGSHHKKSACFRAEEKILKEICLYENRKKSNELGG